MASLGCSITLSLEGLVKVRIVNDKVRLIAVRVMQHRRFNANWSNSIADGTKMR